VGRIDSAHPGPHPSGGLQPCKIAPGNFVEPATCPLGGSCDRVAGHVLDDPGFLAGEFADPVLVHTGAGVEFSRFIYGSLKICLSSLSGEIGAGNVDLERGLFGVCCDDVEIFEVHQYYAVAFQEKNGWKAGLFRHWNINSVLIMAAHYPPLFCVRIVLRAQIFIHPCPRSCIGCIEADCIDRHAENVSLHLVSAALICSREPTQYYHPRS